MRRTIQATAIILTLVSPSLALWPQPTSIQTGSSALILSPNFTFTLDSSLSASAPSDLSDALSRTSTHLYTDKLERLVVGRGSADFNITSTAPTLSSLTLSLTTTDSDDANGTILSIAQEAQKNLGDRDEGYSLSIPADGTDAVLSANTTLGLFRGLTTFEQMWYTMDDGEVYALGVPVTIEDAPVYPFRGFMLDTSRNYFAVDDILRTLDAMSMVKLNTFHWHVTDSQSFPLVVPGFEEISQKGAYSSSSVYTADDVANIVSYAGARGIDVLVEIDTPGHTAIISESHPEHVACPQATPWGSYANEPPAGQLRLTSPDTTSFTSSLLLSVSSMFPSTLMSTGGDEVNMNCYAADEETQVWLNETGKSIAEALSEFVLDTHEVLRNGSGSEEVNGKVVGGKTPVVWEEMVLNYNVPLPNDTVIMVWISSANAAAVAAKGYNFVHAASDYFYLDCGAGEWIGDKPTGNSWCDPFKTWQKSYSFDPTANLTTEEAALVLGGEHLIWAEQSSPTNLDSIVWPRSAAGAEIFWSGPVNTTTTEISGTSADGRNVSNALPRLHDLRFRMVQRGIGAIALQPEWCALRPEACDWSA
ncbi:beta-hexosaminidase [Stereum hirsutum FP-91666 SS1]|uniref:beta-hexosaminidase n=1 Tax=Stereum hirsutum (strain FP-91666) TaxID=721885 RepID=UPI00044496EF|nr:beta-hexosaminidase [Stereum hirsutum FP-91666 SS1]EIM86188.1 beta-hexosaminidase [Stereum hirsutum FP-91666 SS1]